MIREKSRREILSLAMFALMAALASAAYAAPSDIIKIGTLEINASQGIQIGNGTHNFLFVNVTTGRIGIGTSSPLQTLTVVGTANVTGAFIAHNTKCSAGQVLSTTADGTLQCVTDATGGGGGAGWSNTSTLVFNDTANVNVAIGKNAANTKLHVEGDENITGNLYLNKSLVLSGGAPGLAGLTIVSDNVTAGTFPSGLFNFTGTATGQALIVNGSTLVVRGDTGSVGIGTLSPSYKLDVNGDARVNGTIYASSCVGCGQTAYVKRQFGWYNPVNVAATALTSVGLASLTVQGTGAASAQAEMYYVQWTSSTTANSSQGGVTASNFVQGRYGPNLTTTIRTDSAIAQTRIWIALESAALTASDGTGSLTTSYVGVRYSTSAGDTTWQCGSGDGATGSVVDTGVTVSASKQYNITLDWTNQSKLVCIVNGVSVSKTTNLDTTGSTTLSLRNTIIPVDSVAKVHRIAYVYMEHA